MSDLIKHSLNPLLSEEQAMELGMRFHNIITNMDDTPLMDALLATTPVNQCLEDRFVALMELTQQLERKLAVSNHSLHSAQDLLAAAERRWQRDVEITKKDTIERCKAEIRGGGIPTMDNDCCIHTREACCAQLDGIRALAPDRIAAGQASPSVASGDSPKGASEPAAADLIPGLERTTDTEMLDWLSHQYVVVRIPLRYGSRECFAGSPDLEEETWDLRSKIRAEIERLGSKG
jgi:hypothetical protein